MLQEDINFTANTSEAEKSLDNLGKKIEDINNPQKKEQQEVKSLTSAQGEMKNLTDAIKENTKQQKNSLNNQPSQSLLDRIPNDKKIANDLGPLIEKMGTSISSLVKSFAQGDYVSPVIQGAMSTSQKVKNLGEKIESKNDASDLGDFLTSAGALGLIVGGVAIAGNAMSDRYEKDLPQTTRTLASFGNTLTSDADRNQKLADTLRSTLVDYNRNTGLENNEFLDYASSLSRFGIGAGQEIKAGEITQKAANLALLTNGDIGQNLDFMGLIERFGGNGIDTINQAYNSARIQGLDKNQFPEFLSNLQRVIEDGISKGYIKSTKEVATDLAIFSELGKGNAFFEGEYGARTYAQMSNGLANSTNLNSTSSFLVYRAAQDTINAIGVEDALNTNDKGGVLNSIKDTGASWLNTMAYIESGPMNSDFLKNLSNQVNSTYGNDTASKVLTYKEAFGLNYQGAIRMYNLMDELSKTENASQIEKIKTQMDEVTSTPEFKSAETVLADSLSKIDKSIHDVSKGAFEIKSDALNLISNSVEKIREWLDPGETRTIAEYIDTLDISEEGKEILKSPASSKDSSLSSLGGWTSVFGFGTTSESVFFKDLMKPLLENGQLHNNIQELYKQQQKGGNIDDVIKYEYELYSKIMTLKTDRRTTLTSHEESSLKEMYEKLTTAIDKLTTSTDNATAAYNKELTVIQ